MVEDGASEKLDRLYRYTSKNPSKDEGDTKSSKIPSSKPQVKYDITTIWN